MSSALVDVRDGAMTILAALDQRLSAVAERLLPGPHSPPRPTDVPGGVASTLLPELVAACGVEAGPAHWLLLTGVAARFPLAVEVEQMARALELDQPDVVAERILAEVLLDPAAGRLDLPMRIVSDAVVVDVDYCARNTTHTGIQRVVRETMARWKNGHHVVLVAGIDTRTAYRSLLPSESARVLAWGRGGPDDVDAVAPPPELVVPWSTHVIWPEVVDPNFGERIGALAQYSGNTVGLIAYDMIPILTTELRPFGESGIFARFLSAVKHAHRVAGISSSATTEFRGFADMLPSQGLLGPDVREVELPEDIGDHEFPPAGTYAGSRPLVLLTGRREPHKNVRAALHAAERLWSEGLDFEVAMLGSRGWDERLLTETMDRLKTEGRPLTTLGWVTDEEMWGRIRDASFVVFASLHEGYGLPISEALACGTPVITSNYGSQREVGEKGGCILVDPRSDTDLTDAMRTLITQPERLAELRAEILHRPTRTWDDYAADLWRYLVEGTA